MTIFDRKRLTNEIFQLDIDGLRRGYYSDKYFENVVRILSSLSEQDYRFQGHSPRSLPQDPSLLAVGDVVVEAQIFNRRAPIALIAGVDVALAMLRYATGYYINDKWIETWSELEVDAVQDGAMTYYDGDPENVLTVLEIRGRYRDFALLETPILGVLSRASRIATNVYEVMQVSNGKPILFFPARFDLPSTQAIDGYAYWLAIERYNREYGQHVIPLVSTEAQTSWWGGQATGTIPHALIACFLADDVEAMIQFANHIPIETPRILLADFNNDTIGSARATLTAFWQRYQQAFVSGSETDRRRWTLYGVRLDTSSKLRDISLAPDDPRGVNPVLVRAMRTALDTAWESWNVPSDLLDVAKSYCRNTRIIVSGGFNREKIEQFERARVPVDAYGVGSSLLNNSAETNTDFTMDVVRVKIFDKWVDMAKVGRRPCDNPDLQRVKLGDL